MPRSLHQTISLAHQSQEHTGTSTPNLEHEAHLLFQEAVCRQLSLSHPFPGFAVLKAKPCLPCFAIFGQMSVNMNKAWQGP